MTIDFKTLQVDKKFLDDHPNHIFVFGDNTHRKGMGGAAILRHHKQALGFITKINPDHIDGSYYRPENYLVIFYNEMAKLIRIMYENPEKVYMISRLSRGLANKYNIFEKVIQPSFETLRGKIPNMILMW